VGKDGPVGEVKGEIKRPNDGSRSPGKVANFGGMGPRVDGSWKQVFEGVFVGEGELVDDGSQFRPGFAEGFSGFEGDGESKGLPFRFEIPFYLLQQLPAGFKAHRGPGPVGPEGGSDGRFDGGGGDCIQGNAQVAGVSGFARYQSWFATMRVVVG
jgi:hypothetical protein